MSSMPRADQTANERIVIADDRVLHRVGEQEQHDEIERVELRQLALAGEPEPDEQERVDDERANELFADRDAGDEEVGRDRVRWMERR